MTRGEFTELPNGTIIGRSHAVRFFRVATVRDRREIDRRKHEAIIETTDAARLMPRPRRRVVRTIN